MENLDSKAIQPNIGKKGPDVINLHKDPKCLKQYGTLYIGRSDKSPNHFGNPFSHIKSSKGAIMVKNRSEAIEAFEKWITGADFKHLEQDRRHWIIKHLWKVKQAKKLACFCHPSPCHGDILKKLSLKAHPKIH
jgi:hypothetical protein